MNTKAKELFEKAAIAGHEGAKEALRSEFEKVDVDSMSKSEIYALGLKLLSEGGRINSPNKLFFKGTTVEDKKLFWENVAEYKGYQLQKSTWCDLYRVLDPRKTSLAAGNKKAILWEFKCLIKESS
jgi:hypothetical protein